MVDFPSGVPNTTPTFLLGGDEGTNQPARLPVSAAGRDLVSALTVDAQRALLSTGIRVEVPTGTINGTNRVFTLTSAAINDTALVFVGGIYMPPTRYVLSGTTLTFNVGSEPIVGDTLFVAFGVAVAGGGGGGAVSSVNGQTGAVTITAASLNAIPSAEKAAANGVATLGADSQVPSTQLRNASNDAFLQALMFG